MSCPLSEAPLVQCWTRLSKVNASLQSVCSSRVLRWGRDHKHFVVEDGKQHNREKSACRDELGRAYYELDSKDISNLPAPKRYAAQRWKAEERTTFRYLNTDRRKSNMPTILSTRKASGSVFKKKNRWCFIRIHSSEARGIVTTIFSSELEDQQTDSQTWRKSSQSLRKLPIPRPLYAAGWLSWMSPQGGGRPESRYHHARNGRFCHPWGGGMRGFNAYVKIIQQGLPVKEHTWALYEDFQHMELVLSRILGCTSASPGK